MKKNQRDASDQALIATALEDILADPIFVQAGRQSRLLRYIIEETAAGRSAKINQYSIAVDAFDRGADFDPAVDSIVRVEFGRLRSKLGEYYQARPDERVIFRLPKGRYFADIEIGTVTARVPVNAVTNERASVAVLPFINFSGDAEGEYFADGMTDDLITDLSRLSGLRVIARNSVFVYKGRDVPVHVIGEELGVDHVLEGSVRRHGNRLRINAQLIYCPSGDHLWAERFDREIEDVFQVQDEVGRRIVNALSVALTANDRFRFSERGTRNLQAYDCVLRAAPYDWSREGIETAYALYDQAIALDPEYALPHAKMGENRWYAWWSAWSEQNAIDHAAHLAERALKLDDELAAGHAIFGFIQFWLGDFELADAHGERAIALDPGNVRALERRAISLAHRGRLEEAQGYLERARSLNPHEPYFYPRGLLAYMRGEVDEALTLFSESAARFPAFMPTRQFLAS
ncbi:MAG: hypothetical protein O7H40_02795, partial [Gammaproteobacteria bacterium]|nr:hypothetical protein [Gammaproteobacteria bacterium]